MKMYWTYLLCLQTLVWSAVVGQTMVRSQCSGCDEDLCTNLSHWLTDLERERVFQFSHLLQSLSRRFYPKQLRRGKTKKHTNRQSRFTAVMSGCSHQPPEQFVLCHLANGGLLKPCLPHIRATSDDYSCRQLIDQSRQLYWASTR